MDGETILETLRERLSAAQQRSKEASVYFYNTLEEVSCVPHPDGITGFQRAALNYRKTLRGVRAAQEQMAQFLLYNVVPSDLDEANGSQ